MENENSPNSPEKQQESKDELFGNIDELKKKIGYEPPLAEDALWKNEKIPIEQVLDSVEKRDKGQYAEPDSVAFEDLVRRNVEHQFLQSKELSDNPDGRGQYDMTTLEQISLRMTLWKYEELHLKEYADSIERYREHLQTYSSRKDALRNFTDVQALEAQTNIEVRKLNEYIPLLDTSTRLVWCLDLLEADRSGKQKFSDRDRVMLQNLEKSLRAKLSSASQNGEAIHQGSSLEDLRKAQDNYAGLVRTVLQKTANVSNQSVQLPHALYLVALGHQRELSHQEIQNEKVPSAAKYKEFLDVQNKLNQESLSYHIDTLKNTADTVSLLAMRERFGPGTDDALDADSTRKKNLADFYQKFLLPDELEAALKGGDLTINLDGMIAYTEVVGEDAMKYGIMVDSLDRALIGGKQAEDLTMHFKHTVAGWSFMIPEWTLGWGRYVGLDYAKVIGQDDELKNHREYLEFKRIEEETGSIHAMVQERKPKIDVLRKDLQADKAAILQLQNDHPPEECIPGRKHNGVPYEDIRKQYFDAIQAMKNHHASFLAEVDGLYAEMSKILAYHTGRKQQLELLNNENAPSYWWGAGLTAGELVLLSELGRHGGVKSIPYVGWALRPFKSLPFYNYNLPLRAWHFGGRVVNAPTRLATGSYDFLAQRNGWSRIPRVEGEGRSVRPNPPTPTEPAPTRTPSAQAAIDDFARFAKTKEGARLVRDIQQSEQALKTVQQHLGEAFANPDINQRAADIARYQTQRAVLLSADKALRVEAVEKLIGAALNPAQAERIWQAHLNADLGAKPRVIDDVLREVLVDADDATKVAMRRAIMRGGLAGDVTTALEKVGASAAARTGTTAGDVITTTVVESLDDATRTVSPVAREFVVNLEHAGLDGAQSIGELVAKTDATVLREAALISQEAANAERALQAARTSKYVTRGLVGVAALVDAIFIAQNRTALKIAESAGDKDLVEQLQIREKNLLLSASGNAAIGLGVASFTVALPLTAALGAGTWYAERLREHAKDLKQVSPEQYATLSSVQILREMDGLRSGTMAEAATGRGEETRRIRRAYALEAFLRKHVAVESGTSDEARSSAVHRGMEVLAYVSGALRPDLPPTFRIDDPETLTFQSGLDLLSSARNVAALYALRQSRLQSNLPLEIRYGQEGTRSVLDLSRLPDRISNGADIATLVPMLAEFDRYQLSALRTTYLTQGEALSLAEGASDGWRQAGENVRSTLFRRWSVEIARAEDKVSTAFTGYGFDVKRDAALFELRIRIQGMATSYMQVMLNDQNSLEDLMHHEERCVRSLLRVDGRELFDKAQTDRMDDSDFNTLKYSLDQVEEQAFTMNGVLNNYRFGLDEMTIQPVLAARRAMEERIGVPLQYCVSSLIDG